MAKPGLQAEVAELIAQLESRWSQLELDRMPELWDRSETEPVYIAEELRYPVIGWPAFDEYWTRLGSRLRGARYRTSEVRAHELGGGVAVAWFVVDWELVTVETPAPFRGQSRVTAVLRRTASGWRFVHWMEAPIHVAESS